MCIVVVLCSGIDMFFIFGEFGVIGVGLFYELMNNMYYQDFVNCLQFDVNVYVLFISIEGDMFLDIYEDIVWNGCSV